MNAIQLMQLMGEMGTMYHAKDFNDIVDYCALMLHDERVIMIDEDGKPCAFIFYSIGDDTDRFLKKGEYEYAAHEPTAKTVYVEKLVSFKWNRDLRVIFERIIRDKYPQLEFGVWHRRGNWGDRKVVTQRRLKCTK